MTRAARHRDRLVRVGQLAEDRADLAMREAKARTVEAQASLAAARKLREDLLQARATSQAQGIDVERYGHALALDEVGAGLERERLRVREERAAEQDRAVDALAHAHRRKRANASRVDRKARADADQAERRDYDALLDLWNARQDR